MASRTSETALRDHAIMLARRRGVALKELAERYKITRARVQQISQNAERRARGDPADELSARLRNAITAEGCPLEPSEISRWFTYAQLVRVPNIGVLSMAELNAWLVKHHQKEIK